VRVAVEDPRILMKWCFAKKPQARTSLRAPA
jgi:hypothetical protein